MADLPVQDKEELSLWLLLFSIFKSYEQVWNLFFPNISREAT